MNENNNDNDNVLPADFDGVFRFTNFRDTEFKAKWGGIEYTFPPQSTTPMVIPDASPLEIQNIRKKFARELAVEEFYKTPKFVGLNTIAPGGVPALYTDSDLKQFVQRCLEPLPIAQARTKVLPKQSEDDFRKDDDGNNVTQILDKKKSLLKEGSGEIA